MNPPNPANSTDPSSAPKEMYPLTISPREKESSKNKLRKSSSEVYQNNLPYIQTNHNNQGFTAFPTENKISQTNENNNETSDVFRNSLNLSDESQAQPKKKKKNIFLKIKNSIALNTERGRESKLSRSRSLSPRKLKPKHKTEIVEKINPVFNKQIRLSKISSVTQIPCTKNEISRSSMSVSDQFPEKPNKPKRTNSFSPRHHQIRREIDKGVYKHASLCKEHLEKIKNVNSNEICGSFRYFINLHSFDPYFKLNDQFITRTLECSEKERPCYFLGWLIEEFENKMELKPLSSALKQAEILLDEKSEEESVKAINSLLIWKTMTFNAFAGGDILLRTEMYPKMFVGDLFLKKMPEDPTFFIISILPSGEFSVTQRRTYRILKKDPNQLQSDLEVKKMGSLQINFIIEGDWKKNELFSAKINSENLEFSELARSSDKLEIQNNLLSKDL